MMPFFPADTVPRPSKWLREGRRSESESSEYTDSDFSEISAASPDESLYSVDELDEAEKDAHVPSSSKADLEKAYATPMRIDQTEVTLIFSKATLELYFNTV